jgi:hypothetical protein
MRSKFRGDLEQKLAAETASLEERLRTEEELRQRIAVLEKESSALAGQAVPLRDLEVSVKKLSEQFAAFQQSYVCDIDKLVALLLEVQSALPSRKRAGLTNRMRSLLVKPRKDEEEEVVESMIPGLKRTA